MVAPELLTPTAGIQLQPLHQEDIRDEEVEDVPLDHHSFLQTSSKEARRKEFHRDERIQWKRAYWLGLGLFLILFTFWLLDSL